MVIRIPFRSSNLSFSGNIDYPTKAKLVLQLTLHSNKCLSIQFFLSSTTILISVSYSAHDSYICAIKISAVLTLCGVFVFLGPDSRRNNLQLFSKTKLRFVDSYLTGRGSLRAGFFSFQSIKYLLTCITKRQKKNIKRVICTFVER